MMPCPPDVYRFKHKLMLAIPSAIRSRLNQDGLTAESASVNDIIQRALIIEKGIRAEHIYERQAKESNQNVRFSSETHQAPATNTATRRFKKVQGERHSTRPDTSREKDRLNAMQDGKPKFTPRPAYRAATPPRSGARKSRCWGCGNEDHFSSNPKCPRYGKQPLYPNGEKLSRINEEVPVDQNTEKPVDWEPAVIVESKEEDTGEEDPWGGSQYESEDENEVLMARMNETDPFPVVDEDESTDQDDDPYDEPFNDSDSIAEHDEYTMDFTEYMGAITEEKDLKTSRTYYRPNLADIPKKHVPKVRARPRRTAAQNRCLPAYILLNGVPAFTLFDSGSTSDAISPDFARIAKIDTFQLANPIPLQLGTKGSRSKITFGAETSFLYGNERVKVEGIDYFDITNIDRYDLIIGTVFMRKHKIALDFEHDTIRVRGMAAPTLSEGEEATEMARRYAKHVTTVGKSNDESDVEIKSRPIKAPNAQLSATISSGARLAAMATSISGHNIPNQ